MPVATTPPGDRRPGRSGAVDTEAARLSAVRSYDILDTPPEGAFDRVASVAARLFDVPMASVTFVDADRVWFKASHGLDGIREIPRESGLCASAILGEGVLIVPDTLADPSARDNPLVTGAPGARFYAAAPIVTADGHRVGTVNVMDTVPRQITESDAATLTDLAAMVLDALELRLTGARLLRAERERRRSLERERDHADRHTEALTVFATTLQRTLLPPALPTVPGLELACHYQTASPRDVGGDFYDVFPLGEGRWAFFLGDVCGKGAEAAVVTSLARYTLREAAQHHREPTDVLDALNSALLLDPSIGSRYCTCVFGTLEAVPEGGFAVTLAMGGHPPVFHVRCGDDGAVTAESVRPAGGMLVGALEGAHFASLDLRLAPGDGLLLYTDGLTEAQLADGTMLGEDGVAGHLTERASSDADSMVADAVELIAGLPGGASDDVALLALSVPHEPDAPPFAVSLRTVPVPAPRDAEPPVRQENRP
ncbi:PP2C family protein-serine/threonine phosphatase [uncultured Streptomyces sp.]|uniref:PP2C family protein-serine/threonine phosphatase n=1 Tax=uncultured Streptomyces sp. TaxID=174707 RepID=UPI002613FDC8|nr:GAF domain-containing SpoIIE family protein phosphatase [uncultured Streptomyces sp.]